MLENESHTLPIVDTTINVKKLVCNNCSPYKNAEINTRASAYPQLHAMLNNASAYLNWVKMPNGYRLSSWHPMTPYPATKFTTEELSEISPILLLLLNDLSLLNTKHGAFREYVYTWYMHWTKPGVRIVRLAGQEDKELFINKIVHVKNIDIEKETITLLTEYYELATNGAFAQTTDDSYIDFSWAAINNTYPQFIEKIILAKEVYSNEKDVLSAALSTAFKSNQKRGCGEHQLPALVV